jgi:kinesin family protein 6/9
MIGDTRNFKFRGVAPRAVAQVFANISEHPEREFTVSVSYMEIYNERCVGRSPPPRCRYGCMCV